MVKKKEITPFILPCDCGSECTCNNECHCLDGEECTCSDCDCTENLIKEKDKLIASIERRKKLLSNENYVNKAPANVVENDRLQLSKEEEKLEELLSKINK